MSSIGFLIIGAQKAGTSSLFEYMRRHPQLHMPAEKELAFFNREGNFRRGWDWYLQAVSRDAPPGAICGEASTYYMSGTPYGDPIANERHDPPPRSPRDGPLEETVPRRIKQFLPDVKLISVLRDPVERAFSHHRMMVLERAESRSFDQAVAQLLSPSALEEARVAPTRTNNYIAMSEYARVLAGFLHVFPREQLLAITSDDLAQRPAATLAAVFEFLGVASDFTPDNVTTRYRTGAESERIGGINLYTWQDQLARLRPARRAWHSLPDRMRQVIDRRYSVMSYRVSMWNAKRDIAHEGMSAAARENLSAHLRPDSEALADLLGIDLPWLPALARS